MFGIGRPVAAVRPTALWPVLAALRADDGSTAAICDLRHAGADVATVDALVRLVLTARRHGRALRLVHVPEELGALVSFLGLDGVLDG